MKEFCPLTYNGLLRLFFPFSTDPQQNPSSFLTLPTPKSPVKSLRLSIATSRFIPAGATACTTRRPSTNKEPPLFPLLFPPPLRILVPTFHLAPDGPEELKCHRARRFYNPVLSQAQFSLLFRRAVNGITVPRTIRCRSRRLEDPSPFK